MMYGPDPRTASDEQVLEHLVAVYGAKLSELADNIALTRLLIDKGVMTLDELRAEREAALGVLLTPIMVAYRNNHPQPWTEQGLERAVCRYLGEEVDDDAAE